MCARSQHSGDISSDTWLRWCASGTGASSSRGRRRDSSSAATIWGFVTTSAGCDGTPGPIVEQIVGGAARPANEARRILLGAVDGGAVGPHPLERELGRIE